MADHRILSGQMEASPGKYGRMRRNYLKEHRSVLWNGLLLSEKLYPHLREIEETVNRTLEQMIQELKEQNGLTEKQNVSDPPKWTGLMNNLKSQAEEAILTELIYS